MHYLNRCQKNHLQHCQAFSPMHDKLDEMSNPLFLQHGTLPSLLWATIRCAALLALRLPAVMLEYLLA